MNEIEPFLEAAVRTATPLLLAALGESVSERAGVINIGLEGCIVAGAYAAFVAAGPGLGFGFGAAVGAGLAVGVLMVVFALVLRRDQIIVGTALTMLALGATGTLFRARGEADALVQGTTGVVRIPVLAELPLVGSAFFSQPLVTYLAFLMVPTVWWFLYRTHGGLVLRAVGEAPEAAHAVGARVSLWQAGAVLFGSAMGGLAGGALVLAQAGAFAEGMSAGRGFLAIAIVALGRWHPVGAAVAALVFGAAMAVQFVVQSLGWTVRYELALMIPYILTLVALGAFARGAAPAMLGRSSASG